MTDNEIIKCLEGINNATFDEDQSPVIYMKLESAKSILNLINRLTAEKEGLIAGQETLQKALAEKNAEIYNLKEDLSEYRNMPILTKNDCLIATVEKRADGKQYHNELLTIKVDEIRAEAYKEFAERLKAEKFTHINFGELVYVDDVDNTLKELTEKGGVQE